MSAPSPEHERQLSSFRMPAEWAPHLATYLVWPHNLETWPGKFEPIPPLFAQYGRGDRALRTGAHPGQQCDRCRRARAATAKRPRRIARRRLDRIDIIVIPTNDSWVRDHGPIFVNRCADRGANAHDNSAAQIALDWRFNSWGEKYGRYDLDDVVPRRLGEHYGFPVIPPASCSKAARLSRRQRRGLPDDHRSLSVEPESQPVAKPGRNRSVSQVVSRRDQYPVARRRHRGRRHRRPHRRPCALRHSHTIVTVVEDDPADANYRVLADNLARLRSLRDERRGAFTIETLPMPPALHHDGTRLPASPPTA